MKHYSYASWVLVVFIASFFSGCAYPPIAAVDRTNISTDLDRFKYILVLGNANQEFVSVNDQLDKAFSDAGLIPVKLMDVAEMDLVEKLCVLVCDYNYYLNAYSYNAFINLNITLKSVQLGTSVLKDEMKLNATANSYGKDTMFSNITLSLKEVYHGHDKTAMRSNYLESYKKITSNPYRYHKKSLEEVRTYLDENRSKLDPIEGIWTPYKLDDDCYADKDRIGIFPCDSPNYDFYATIMDGNIIWLDGEVRMKIRKTSNSSIYSCTVFTNDRMEISANAMLSLDGILKLNIDSKYAKDNVSAYIKDYPPSVESNFSSSNSVSTGTGFLLSPKGYIVTCQHVVEDATNIYVIDNSTPNNRLAASVVVSDKNNDLCILKVNGLSIDSNSSLPYGFDTGLNRTGESVFCMGYPLTQVMGNEIKVTNGIISSVTGFEGDTSCYQVSTPVQAGNSGGPLFNSSGNVIGIINSKIPQAENVSYAVKTAYLSNLLGLVNNDIHIGKKNISTSSLPSLVDIFKSAVYIIEVEH